jgi:hypothetical protein
MRYKIKAQSASAYEQARSLLEASEVRVFVESDRRLTLSTGDLSPGVRQGLEELGVEVSQDFRYDMEDL